MRDKEPKTIGSVVVHLQRRADEDFIFRGNFYSGYCVYRAWLKYSKYTENHLATYINI